MEIKGKVHLMFEQSGTFKNEFKKLGYEAYDNNPSMFDNITSDDLIVAFFPCIYFTGATNPRYFTLENNNYKALNLREKFDTILERAENRQYLYKLLYKLVGVCMFRKFRLIIENPYSTMHYLCNNFLKSPTIFDGNRLLRGDYFKKPTGYWYFNCEPTYGESYQDDKKQKTIFESKGGSNGLCSEERSMISPDYARNWICDFVLGKKQDIGQLQLF